MSEKEYTNIKFFFEEKLCENGAIYEDEIENEIKQHKETLKISKSNKKVVYNTPLENYLSSCINDIFMIVKGKEPIYMRKSNYNSIFSIFVAICSHYITGFDSNLLCENKKAQGRNHISMAKIFKTIIDPKKDEIVDYNHKKIIDKIIVINNHFNKCEYLCNTPCEHFYQEIRQNILHYINTDKKKGDGKIQKTINEYL